MSNTSRPRRLRAVTYAVILCCALGVLAATPVLATSTILRTELGILLTGATSRDATIAESPEFTAEVITGLRLDPAWIQDPPRPPASERAWPLYRCNPDHQHEQPECKWVEYLAAIGCRNPPRHHLRISTGRRRRGRACITGPALDGGQFKGIPDSDNGAVATPPGIGRLTNAFIPKLEIYGATASDGIADPQNIDDAAFSAAARCAPEAEI